MENWSTNPYFNMAVIRSPEMFFGRVDLLNRFYGTLDNRQSISLIGPRHIGKSSFLWCASSTQKQLSMSNLIFVLLDLREYLDKTTEDFFHNVSKEIILQIRRMPDLILHAEGRGEEEFSNLLDQIEEQGYFPVLLLDAFDNITRNQHFGPEFFSFLRAHATIGKVSYVTASIAPLYHVCHHDIVDSPFFNIFYVYHLEALAPNEARELIVVPAQRMGMPFMDTEVEWVLKMAGRHPFFIQRVCYILFEEKNRSLNDEVNILAVQTRAYNDLLPHFQDTWERLSEAQRSILQDEVQQKGNKHRELPELSESGFFRQFVRNTRKVAIFHMTAQELELALDKMANPKALGETNLRFLKLVSNRLGNESSPSTVEKGLAIRGILKEALERLRGSGVRTDSSLDWRNYNILNYRFFQYHLKNEQIRARLQFTSDRTYFRERNSAIDSLLNVLFEMEKASDLDE